MGGSARRSATRRARPHRRDPPGGGRCSAPCRCWPGLLLWYLLALVTPGRPTLLPGPGVVAARLWDLAASGVLWRHVGPPSARRARLPAGGGAGFALGYPVAKSRLLEALLAPYVAGTQAVPVVAIAPLMVLWFGLDLPPKVLTCAVIVFFPILVNTVIGCARWTAR